MELKKKIIFSVTSDLTYDQRMQKICRSLSNAGYDIELVGRERKSSDVLNNEPFKQTRLKCRFTKGKLFYMEYNIRLFSYLRNQDFDAACAIDLDTIMAVYFAKKSNNIKLVYDAHEYFTEVPEVVRRKLIQNIWKWVERTFVPKFDLAYTVSPAIAELFSKKYNKKFDIILNTPVLESETLDKVNTKESTLLYQGALNEGRGLENLIEAMQGVNAKLLLAGEGDLSKELRDLVKRLNLENKVQFLGYVKPYELKRLTELSTIGINLLENKGLSYYYSLSNKFFDYIHAGLPQVCIDFPEYRKINDAFDVALLTKDCSIDEIKKAVQRLLSDQELYTRLQKNCEVCSEKLNWQNEEKKLVDFYNELLR